MFHKHEECIGIPILKLGRYYIELWYCKAGYSIKEHYHELQNNRIVFLFGDRITFFKRYSINDSEISIKLYFKDFLKSFVIESKCYHRFVNKGRWPFIFINISRFLGNFNPVSASEDFKTI